MKRKDKKKKICNSQKEHEEEKIKKEKYKNFILNMNKFVVTTRFTNYTWNENLIFRNKNTQFGCIYGSPDILSKQIKNDSIVFVLEMNNDKNRIMGIGMVRNHPIVGKYNIYSKGNYNRYIYSGKNRIDREEMTEIEENIMKAFDILCFKGYNHMKRGNGIKSFPKDILFKCMKVIDLVEFISEMFKKRIQKK